MSHFDEAVKRTLIVEGEFSNDPKDSGGATKWGISERVARAFGYKGPMSELPRSVAVAIYKTGYWDVLKLSGVAFFYPEVAYELFESSVNSGPEVVAVWMQEVLNAMNVEGTFYPDLKVDGLVGPKTLTALRMYHGRRGRDGGIVLLASFNALQGVRYLNIVKAFPKNERFLYGWILNRVAIAKA